MALSGWSGTNRITQDNNVPTGVPLTLFCRAYINSTADGLRIAAGIGDASGAGATHWFQLRVAANETVFASTRAGGTISSAVSTTALAATTWYALGAVYSAVNNRKVYVDGVDEATETTSVTPTGITRFRPGMESGGTGATPFTGRLAEVALWNAALTDEEMAALNTMSPLAIRPQSLIHYMPLINSGALDLVSDAATVSGTLTEQAHPRVHYPRRRRLIVPKGLVVPTGKPIPVNVSQAVQRSYSY